LLISTLVLFSAGCHRWRAVNNPAFEGGKVVALASDGQRLVAVGLVHKTYGMSYEYDAAIWTSEDGQIWARVPHDDSLFGGPGNQDIADVIWTGSRFVAGGTDGSGGDADVAVWNSDDGLNWNRVPHDETVFGGSGHQIITELGVGSTGVIAIGQSEWPGAADYNDPAAWFSADGVSWSAVVLGDPATEAGGQLPHDIVVDRPGIPILAEVVGYDGNNPGNCGHWGITSIAGSPLTMMPGLTALNLCDPTTAWQHYPKRVAHYDGYTYGVGDSVRVPVVVRDGYTYAVTYTVAGSTVHTVYASPPEGGWTTLAAFDEAMFANVLGDGQYDGAFAVVGNVGDFEGMSAWVWRVGQEDRTTLSRVLSSEERIVSYAYDVTEFRKLPVAVGYDFIGSIMSPQRARGVAWYRMYCSIFQLPFCQPG
jgi:hypothetical protein